MKPVGEFYRKTATRLMSRCKACYRVTTEAYRRANPTVFRIAARRSYQKHQSAVLARKRAKRAANLEACRQAERDYETGRKHVKQAYRAKNAVQIRLTAAEYRRKNAAKIKAANAAYRAERRAVLKERQREWREANPDAYREIHRRWKRANRAKVNAATHRRRAAIRGCSEHYTAVEWEALKAACGRTCLWCGRGEPDIALTVDHVVPVSKGGSNAISNIQPLCKSCNSKKHDADTDFRSGPRRIKVDNLNS